MVLHAESEAEYLAAIVESAADAIIGKDLNGIITVWNREAERVFGYSAQEIVGKPILLLIPDDRSEEERSVIERIKRGERVARFDTVRRKKDGETIDVSISIAPIRDKSGQVVGASKTVHDISHRKRQDEDFRLVAEASPTAMILVSPRGRIRLVNAQTEKLFGYSREELIGNTVEMLVPVRSRGGHEALRAGFFSAPSARSMGAGRDLYGLRKDGSEVPVEIGLNPVPAAEGTMVLASIIDISERKRQDERFRLVVEASPTAIIVVAARGEIRLVNTQTEKLFGYSREELVGNTVEMLVPERSRGGHEGLRTGFFSAPSARSMGAGRDLYGLRKDGVEIPIEIGLNPVRTDEGTIVLASIIDISERKNVEALLLHRRSELERSNRDLEQFAYVASHDLQEPLRAVGGCVQLLQQRYAGQIDERADEYISHAIDGCARMRLQIDDLLTFSRVGKHDDVRGPVNCVLALSKALQNLSAVVAESGAKITWDEALPSVPGVMSEFVMLFQNLLSNAIKFRRSDAPPLIHISAESDGKYAVFAVADNGIGIEPEYFERVFGIFQRLHTRQEYPGTGIGLALCKKIVEQRGGRIWVESDSGQGTTFRFSLTLTDQEKR